MVKKKKNVWHECKNRKKRGWGEKLFVNGEEQCGNFPNGKDEHRYFWKSAN